MKKIKQVLIVWVSIYPTITLILLLFGQQLNQVPLALRTLVLTLFLVPAMVYILIPFWTKAFVRMETLKSRHLEKNQRQARIKDSK